MAIVGTVIQMMGGVAGGKAITSNFRNLSSGKILDLILGLIGGFAAGQVVGLIPGLDQNSTDIVNVLANLIAGGLGGGAATALGGLITQRVKK